MTATIELGSLEEAKAYAVQHEGRWYILAPETLAQIEAAETNGGYEGGMSGASGEGGYSAEGSPSPNSSSATDTAPGAYLDPDEYYWKAGVLMEGVIDTVLGLRDLMEGIKGDPGGPIILVPKRELDKLFHGAVDDGA